MIISWFENLVLLISGILGCPENETLGAYAVEPLCGTAGGTQCLGASQGVGGAMPILARRFLWPSGRR